jgi:hypothetical protein
MAWELDYPEEEHSARLIIGDPVAEAYEWIKAYAKSISRDGYDEDYGSQEITAEELISTASNNIQNKDGWGDYISKGGLLEGMSVDSTFWDKLSIIKGIEIPANKRNNFFSCSC